MDSVKQDAYKYAYKYDLFITILFQHGTWRVERLPEFVHKCLLCPRIDIEIEPSLQTSDPMLCHPNSIYLAMQEALRCTEAPEIEKGYC